MSPLRVLFVDDEPGIRQTLPAILRMHGFEVTSAGTVSDALSEIASHPFDILISDLNIGQPADGFTVVSAMRRTQPDCLTFILTGYPALESALEAIRNQVDDYLLKPTDASRLVETIAERLKNRGPRHVDASKRISAILRENALEIAIRTLEEMKSEPELAKLPLRDEERVGYVAQMIEELSQMLESQTPEKANMETLRAAGWHGQGRLRLGYSIPMLVTDIRLLERVINEIIQEHLMSVNLSCLMLDLKHLNENLAIQLEQTLKSYLRGEGRAA